MIGRTAPLEPLISRDPRTGAEVHQLTVDGTKNICPYFTNVAELAVGPQNYWYLSNRSGRNEYYWIDLPGRKTIQLTDHENLPQYSACAHPNRPEFYFTDRRQIYQLRLDTLVCEPVFRAPEGYDISILNANTPRHLAFHIMEQLPACEARSPNSEAWAPSKRDLFHRRPRCTLYRLDLDSWQAESVWGECKLLQHVQSSPIHPDHLIFSSWCGYGDHRCQFIDCSREEKNCAIPLFPESATARAGHEFISPGGNIYCQWMELADAGPRDFIARLMLSESETAPEETRFEKFRIPSPPSGRVHGMNHHFSMAATETWGLHDRFPTALSMEDNNRFLSLFRLPAPGAEVKFLPLCACYDGSAARSMGPGATLVDGDHSALFARNTGQEQHLCLVGLEGLLEKLL